MRIHLLHQAFGTPDQPMGTRHWEFAAHLGRRGHDVTVITSRVDHATGRAMPERPATAPPEGVRIVRVASPSGHHSSIPSRLASYGGFSAAAFATALREPRPDVVWGTSPSIFQAAAALAAARARRAAFLLEVRDLWPDFAVEMGVVRSPALIAAGRTLERTLYRAARAIVVNSPGFVPHLARHGVPASKVHLVPNGVDPTEFDPAADGRVVRDRHGLGGAFLVVYAGAHGPANDLGSLLDAAERLRGEDDVRFLLVGDGKERRALEDAARRRGLSNVVFAGPQPKAAAPAYLAAADVCVASLRPLRTFTTTYPNKVFDYMAAGRPVVLAIDGVIRDVIEEASGGTFVPPGDSSAMAAAIRAYRDDPALRRKHGEAARLAVERKFDRRAHVELMEAALDAARGGQP